MSPENIVARVFSISGPAGKDGETPELSFANLKGNIGDNVVLMEYINEKVGEAVLAELTTKIGENALGQYINEKVGAAVSANLTEEIDEKVTALFNETFRNGDEVQY